MTTSELPRVNRQNFKVSLGDLQARTYPVIPFVFQTGYANALAQRVLRTQRLPVGELRGSLLLEE